MRKKEVNLFSAHPAEKEKKTRRFRLPAGRFAACIACAAALIFAFAFALPRAGFSEGKFAGEQNYKCIVNVWHIDSFEGGVGSRAEFLLRRAAEFEKKRAGVFVMVTALTAENAKERLAAGELPDAISYGYGLEFSDFSPVDTERESPFGSAGGDVYAVPWCMGGYAVLSRGELPAGQALENAVVSKGKTTQPYAALALSGYTLRDYTEKSPLDAYYCFVSGGADVLVGTQRDINRLFSRDEEAFVTPLGGYNDLYQYFSITSSSAEKKAYAEEFIDYVLSDGVQAEIFRLGMFSPYRELSFSAEGLETLQKERRARGISAFLPAQTYAEFSSLSRRAAEGDGAALKKIENLLA